LVACVPQGDAELGLQIVFNSTEDPPELSDLYRALTDLDIVYIEAARLAGIEPTPPPPRLRYPEPIFEEEFWMFWRGGWWRDREVFPGLAVQSAKLESPLELVSRRRGGSAALRARRSCSG
jgi:hypothetical protein